MENNCLRVHQCSMCSGDTHFICISCQCELCLQCKENHVNNLKTIDHNVVIYRKKFDCVPNQNISKPHSDEVCRENLEFCHFPDCSCCNEKRTHGQIYAETVSDTKRQIHKGIIHVIRSEVLFNRYVLLTGIKADIEKCQKEISRFQPKLIAKTNRLANLIDYVQNEFMNKVFCDFDFKHRCLKQLINIDKHILSIQKFEHRHERSAINPVKFLTKKSRFQKNINLIQHINQLSMIESINKKDVMKLLNEFKITERRGREVKNESLLKLMPGPELHQSLTLPGVDSCYHISRVTSDRVWVSDEGKNLILTNTDGEHLYHIDDVFDGYFFGYKVHTANKDGELMYINKDGNLKKLSNDLKTTTTLIKSNLNSRCVYCSLISGDLLVGVYYCESRTGLVIRYNHSGQLKQIIQDDTRLKPHSVTENNNGDVIVSLCDCDYNLSWDGIVVVTDNEGGHRFTYSGNGYGIFPRGICTDVLSHILVCDGLNSSIHILDKDGQFLSYLFIRPSGIFSPLSLSYDVTTHRLWIGSENNNTLCVYRFITRQGSLTGKFPFSSIVNSTLCIAKLKISGW